MKLALEPTDRIERVEGTPCRVWTGTTEAGTPVLAWIAILQPQTHDPDQLAAFDAALRDMPYRRELVSFDYRMVS